MSRFCSTVALIVVVFLGRGYLGYVLMYAYAGRGNFQRHRFKVYGAGIEAHSVHHCAYLCAERASARWERRCCFAGSSATVTKEGLNTAVFMALRLALLVFGTQLLTLTTSPIALTDGLESLMSPLSKIGFPYELAMMMSIALRFIPSLLEEADKIMKAQMALC